jgi:protein associated with RNAse G/E
MTPFIIEEKTIKYIDYDIDLRVFPDGKFKILDKREYEYHRNEMHYPNEIDDIVKFETKNLIRLGKEQFGPFSLNFVNQYYNKYLEVLKSVN